MNDKDEIEKLKQEVIYWKQVCHKLEDEIEKLSLDLGVKNKDFINQGEVK